MAQNSKRNSSAYTIFGIPIDGDAGYPQLIKLVSVICGFTAIAAWHEIQANEEGLLKALWATLEHSANSVPISICIIVLSSLIWRYIMNISEWLKDKHDEKKRQRAELRLTQAREEGWQEGQQVGWQKGRQVGRREVIEWYESKKNDPTNNEPPPWEN